MYVYIYKIESKPTKDFYTLNYHELKDKFNPIEIFCSKN